MLYKWVNRFACPYTAKPPILKPGARLPKPIDIRSPSFCGHSLPSVPGTAATGFIRAWAHLEDVADATGVGYPLDEAAVLREGYDGEGADVEVAAARGGVLGQ
eukprot:1180091-Prorocentrum_minimum.AAC.2